MDVSASNATLDQIRISDIDRNPENPRLHFRKSELDELLESIRVYGVQVPISVYKQGRRYVLIDGERRWRCCAKLNMKTIPALIQESPTELGNLLLMFNIHALREQWDLLTIATKLPRIIGLMEMDLGRAPRVKELSQRTGLAGSVITRCKMLLGIPDEYVEELLAELALPKSKQKLSEDLLIEVERAISTVQKKMPDAMPDKDSARRVLIDKYKSRVIDSVIQFRNIPKIARAENVDADEAVARKALRKLFQVNSYSAKQAFNDSVASAYAERDVLTRVNALTARLSDVVVEELDSDLRSALHELCAVVSNLLEE